MSSHFVALGLLPFFFSTLSGSQAAQLASHQDASSAIDRLVALHPEVQLGRIGFEVVDLQSGEVICQRDSEAFLAPASNAKLYTSAFALERLGPDTQFRTVLQTTGLWKPGSRHIPDLQLVGGGDPNLSGRILPYSAWVPDRNPLSTLSEMADKLTATGIRSIDGDVTGVSVRYGGQPYPEGWTIDDSVYGYGAPVTDLALNDNTVSLTVRRGEAGDLAEVSIEPASPDLVVLNQVLTSPGKQREIHLLRPPGSNELLIWGSIGTEAGIYQEDLAIPDPAQYAAQVFVQLLRERGVSVRGEAKAKYCPQTEAEQSPTECDASAGTSLLVHQSAPLWQSLQIVNKVSQNLHAEMLLRNTAIVTGSAYTLEAALDERRKFLAGLGEPKDAPGLSVEDGSGLARQDLTTPAATVVVLRYMWLSPHRERWLQLLPTGGVDGSLAHRFRSVAGAERVHAKTGSLSHVNTLSGYLQTQSGRWLCFSIMVNDTVGKASAVRDFLDAFCQIFLAE